MSSTTSSPSAAATAGSVAAATTPATAARLIDQDPKKFRSLKKVIVVGHLDGGVESIGDALRTLGFKVYDTKTAIDNRDRDLPLWLEAAEHRNSGTPFTQADYDKIIGNHDAVVGGLAGLFNEEFVKLYPSVKIVIMPSEPETSMAATVHDKITSMVSQRYDPDYMGAINRLNEVAPSTNIDFKAIREVVREKNLLEMERLTSWDEICQFLNVPTPDKSLPSSSHNSTTVELATRNRYVMSSLAKETGEFTFNVFKWIGIIAMVILSMSVLITNTITTTVICVGLLVFGEAANSAVTKSEPIHQQIAMEPTSPVSAQPTPPMTTKPTSTLPVVSVSPVKEAEKPTQKVLPPHVRHARNNVQKNTSTSEPKTATRQNNDRRGGNRSYNKQPNSQRSNANRMNNNNGRNNFRHTVAPKTPRPTVSPNANSVRPTLPNWGNFQDFIHKDDMAKQNARRAAAEKVKDDRVVITATHRQTDSDKKKLGGRQVLSVMTEKMD